jgi:hypothetical protein
MSCGLLKKRLAKRKMLKRRRPMIPPLQPIRLRSITRWMQDSDPKVKKLPPEELQSRATEMDDLMIEAFENREDVLKAQLMKDKIWGTAQGMTQFPLDRMVLWQEVVAEFLPTSDQPQED